jgi:hypothetical protein
MTYAGALPFLDRSRSGLRYAVVLYEHFRGLRICGRSVGSRADLNGIRGIDENQ